MKHKLLSIWLATLFSMVASVASAYDFSVGGIYYNITSSTDKTVAVTFNGTYSWSVNEYYSGDIVIPNRVTYNGTTYTVTSIGEDAFDDCIGLTSISIPNSVTSIGNNAFSGCTALPSIILPENVTSIGTWAFSNCSGLTSILIPGSVTSIGNYAFQGCSGLTSITIPESVTSIGTSAFSYCKSLESITVNSANPVYDSRNKCNAIIETSSNTLIAGCKNSIIPEDVSSIGKCAFQACEGLASITIPDNVTSIDNGAFNGCTSLTSITIPENVVSIGANAFYYCPNLASIIISSPVISIGLDAFEKTAWMENQPDGVVYVGQTVYKYKGTMSSNTAIELQPFTRSICKSAFSGCTGLTSIQIPDNVSTIGGSSFNGCTGLTSLTIPESVTSIGDYAFGNCSGLTSISIPDNVKTIGSGAFRDCTNLASVEIGCGVDSIAANKYTTDRWGTSISSYGAFYGCTSLTDVAINSDSIASKAYTEKSTLADIFGTQVTHYAFGDSVTTIGKYACYNLTELEAVSFGENVKDVGYNAFTGCTGLTKAEYASLSSACSINYSYVGHPLSYANLFVDGEEVTDVVIPEGIDAIGNYAFAGYGRMTSVSLPNSIASIGGYAFNGCTGLTSLTIPESVTSIGVYAFSDCTGLSSITIPANVTSIGGGAFSGCTGLTEVSIPKGVTAINSYTFKGCSGLTSVTIPESVTLIDRGAFNDCIGLTSVVIPEKVDSIGVEGYAITDWSSYSYYVPGAFNGCTNLTDVTINSNSIASKTYTSKSTLAKVFGTQVTHYTFGDSVKAIGNYACYGLETLDSITLGNNLRSIGDYAFKGCEALTSISFPDSLQIIGRGAFSGCSDLTSVSFGESVTSVGFSAFEDCDDLEKAEFASLQSLLGIDFDVSFSRWGDDFTSNPLDYATLYINGENITDVVVPETVTSIGSGVFAGYSALKSITMGDNVEAIGYGAFASCSNLDSVVIGNHVKSIGQYAFANCYRIASITIGDNVSYIGSDAFYECSGLTDVTINSDSIASKSYYNAYSIKGLSNIFGTQVTHYTFGGAVRAIGDYACYNLENLKAVTIGDSVKAVGEYAFRSTGLEKAEFESIGSLCDIEFANESSNPLYWAQHLFVNGEELTEVVIPEGVTAIKKYAFIDCVGLTSLSIPESVTSIGEGAFYYCTGLTSISIPNGVTTIGKNAFNNCTGLTSAYIGSSVASFGTSPFYGCTALTDVTINSNAIASKTYSSSSRLSNIFGTQVTNYTFGDSVTAIGDYACYNLTGLKSVVLGDNVASLGQYAFSGCTGLTSMELPDNMTSIGTRAFGGCTGFTEIVIGKEMSTISDGAFYGCSNMKSVTINSNPLASQTYSESYTLANLFGNQVSHYTFGDGVKAIGAYACSNLTNLNVVTLSESVDTIGANAFLQCTGLTMAEYASMERACQIWYGSAASNPLFNAHHLYINGEEVIDAVVPESVNHIEYAAFAGCTELKSVAIPNSVEVIDQQAFRGCTGLTSVTIPASVKNILPYAFYNCAGLTSIDIVDGVKSIGLGTFSGCSSLESIALPESIESIAESTFYNCTGLSSIDLPDSLKTIGGYAFRGCSGLQSVDIPVGVKQIDEAAFAICTSLVSVTLPEEIDSIANSTFYGCSALTEISIPENVRTIGEYAFFNCTNLASASMSEGLDTIFYAAFAQTGLKSVTIPASVKSMGNFAFYNCPDLKTLVVYADGLPMNESIFRACPVLNEIVATGRLNMTVPDNSTVLVPSALVAEMQAEYRNATVLPLESTDATQTTVSLSSATDDFKLLSAATGDKEVQVNEGVVKLTGCTPANSYTVNVAGEAFGLPVSIPLAVMTEGLSLAINAKDATNTTLTVQGSYDAGDATVTYAGFDGYEAGNEATVTGLKPGESTSFTYRVKTDDGSEFTVTQDLTTKPITIVGETISKTATSVVLKGKLEDLIDVEVESMGFEDSDYESDELTLTGLTPNTTYSRHFKVTLADGGEAEADIEFTTEELTLTTQLPKVVNEGQVILTALSNLDDSETEIGFEWRRQDWSDDFNSKYADAHLFGGTMEGYINNMNVMFLWKYRPYYTAADGTTYYGDWKGIDPTDYSHFDPTVYTYAANSMEEGTVEIKGYAQCGSDEIASQGFKYWTGTEDMPVDATSVEADGTVMTATLIDLLSATTYSYVAYVTTTKGETFYGERQTFQTGGADATIMLQTWDDEVTDDVEAIYDLNGRRIAKVQRGVNIIRYTDGTTRKVRVK